MTLHFPHKPIITFDWHHSQAHYKDEFQVDVLTRCDKCKGSGWTSIADGKTCSDCGSYGSFKYELSFNIEVSATIKETPGADYDSPMEKETTINTPYITNIRLLDNNGDLVAIDEAEIERLIINNLSYE